MMRPCARSPASSAHADPSIPADASGGRIVPRRNAHADSSMDATALTCPQCGAVAAPDAIQCSFCHARLATTACPSCFGLVFVGSKHCQHCGAAITAVQARTSALRRHLEALTSRHEASREQPWSVNDAPSDYIERQMGAIVGVEIEITRLEGKWKMSQNRVAEDIDGVIAGLEASDDAAAREVAGIVRARRPSDTR